MKWSMIMESDGFGFKFTVDNDGDLIVAKGGSVVDCLRTMATEIQQRTSPGRIYVDNPFTVDDGADEVDD